MDSNKFTNEDNNINNADNTQNQNINNAPANLGYHQDFSVSQEGQYNSYDVEKLYYEAKQRLKNERQRIKAERKKAKLERKMELREKRKLVKLEFSKVLAVGLICAIIGGIISSLGTLVFYKYGAEKYGYNFLGILDDTPTREIEKTIIVNENVPETVAIAEKVTKSVVGIRVTTQTTGSFLESREEHGEGSGIIYREDGYIITNFHVIQRAIQSDGKQKPNSQIDVVLPSEPDKTHSATVVGYDWMTDLAVIKINAKHLPVIDIGNSDEIKLGELAVAVGNPGGLNFMGSISVGVISGLNRQVYYENIGSMTLIQTDAAINPGNSGGPLVNRLGELIGVNSVKLVSTEYEGMGFAIPSNQVVEICNDLIENKYVKGRPFIGVIIDPNYTPSIAQQLGMPEGVLVDSVTPASPAYKAGVERGDIIIKFNNVRVKTFEELNSEKNKYKPGDKVTMTVSRDGKELTLELTLSESYG